MDDIRNDDDWLFVKGFLPEDLDLLAREAGALKRKREIRSAEDLLRLALAYAEEGASLREVSAWAKDSGLAVLSDVAVLKRLRAAAPFLALVVSRLVEKVPALGPNLHLRLIDATVVCRRRSRYGDFRVHIGYQVQSGQISGIALTPISQGESLGRLPFFEGEVLVGDMAYSSRAGFWEAAKAGAHVLVRTHPRLCSLVDGSGQKVDVMALARDLKPGQVLDEAVWTRPARGVPSIAVRLVAIRMSDRSAQENLRRKERRAQRNGTQPSAALLEAARYLFILTTLEAGQACSGQILEAYRLRWQVEMLFKRLKGVVTLGELKARDKLLCESLILAKLALVLLLQKMESSFSPWGYALKGPEPLANLA